MNKFSGKFKGIFHVYEIHGHRYIETYSFVGFEDTFLSDNIKSLEDEFRDGGHQFDLLNYTEIADIESKDFFFEIVGDMEIDFFHSSWEDYSEVDSELNLDNYKINILDYAQVKSIIRKLKKGKYD